MTTVGTAHLPAGQLVLTTPAEGTDFGLPLVRPARSRRGSEVREVRAHCRARGGVVVWFTDGSKTPPLHGRTAWTVADREPDPRLPGLDGP
ncbi:hypothetical protein [Modestobacter sp. NPDC049651]|uniref:hypothetical protein n=1 Tax=unclassified Modestobacter TaxID=2643866 RepID=UPI003404664C